MQFKRLRVQAITFRAGADGCADLLRTALIPRPSGVIGHSPVFCYEQSSGCRKQQAVIHVPNRGFR